MAFLTDLHTNVVQRALGANPEILHLRNVVTDDVPAPAEQAGNASDGRAESVHQPEVGGGGGLSIDNALGLLAGS